ncbi:hypothetical protein K2Q16_02805 [Patescibacteria group bacterium]|nr:hypothetical protein [Patescibacteria group bacterium]
MNYSLEHSAYHKILRVSCVVMATVLIFESGLFTSATARLADQTGLYLANAVGVYVGVSENGVNTLTTRIAELEQEVGKKDAMLRDLDVGLLGSAGTSPTSTFVLAGILFIMLVLIVLNYALDFVRSRELYDTTRQKTELA